MSEIILTPEKNKTRINKAIYNFINALTHV